MNHYACAIARLCDEVERARESMQQEIRKRNEAEAGRRRAEEKYQATMEKKL